MGSSLPSVCLSFSTACNVLHVLQQPLPALGAIVKGDGVGQGMAVGGMGQADLSRFFLKALQTSASSTFTYPQPHYYSMSAKQIEPHF